jgi:hypothetical protein
MATNQLNHVVEEAMQLSREELKIVVVVNKGLIEKGRI